MSGHSATGGISAQQLGSDRSAAQLDVGAEASLEQLKRCDAEVLLSVRPRKLKEVLAYMGVDHSVAVEKKELVALIVKSRDLRGAPGALNRQFSGVL